MFTRITGGPDFVVRAPKKLTKMGHVPIFSLISEHSDCTL